MKEIVILFFTFLGICKGLAQNAADKTMPDSLSSKLPVMQKPVTDSLQGAAKATAKLYPNPAKNKTTLEVKGFEPGEVQIKIIDNTGKTCRDDKRLLLSGNENIVMMFSLPAGIYVIIINQHKNMVRKKLVIL